MLLIVTWTILKKVQIKQILLQAIKLTIYTSVNYKSFLLLVNLSIHLIT